MQSAGCRTQNIRDREVRVFGVHGRTPLDAAECAAGAGAVLPNHFAALFRIERPSDAGLLPNHDHTPAMRQPLTKTSSGNSCFTHSILPARFNAMTASLVGAAAPA